MNCQSIDMPIPSGLVENQDTLAFIGLRKSLERKTNTLIAKMTH